MAPRRLEGLLALALKAPEEEPDATRFQQK
jgi:hypothetical protein